MDKIRHFKLPTADFRTELREGIVRALRAVSVHFSSTINIEGLSATDLFAMNTLLGGAIEEQTVATLNMLRTDYWKHRSKNAMTVIHPETHPYPEAGSSYSDVVNDDKGGNFGRIARISGLMDDWIDETVRIKLSGIEARWWIRFLRLFDEKSDEKTIQEGIRKLALSIGHNSEWADEVLSHITRLIQM